MKVGDLIKYMSRTVLIVDMDEDLFARERVTEVVDGHEKGVALFAVDM